MYNDGKLVLFFVFVALGWAFVRLSAVLFRTYFSPLGIYTGIWFASLAIFYLGIVRYYDLGLTTLLAFFVAILTFASGSLIARSIMHGKPNANSTHMHEAHLYGVVVIL